MSPDPKDPKPPLHSMAVRFTTVSTAGRGMPVSRREFTKMSSPVAIVISERDRIAASRRCRTHFDT
jgi:hypothetical protein